jgi:acylphosphatase
VAKSVDVTVQGRVQGVSFRFYTERQAHKLGVKGWVRNEPDGSVAAHFEGADDVVDAMVEWCRQGPPMAHVRNVAVREGHHAGHTSFDVRF